MKRFYGVFAIIVIAGLVLAGCSDVLLGTGEVAQRSVGAATWTAGDEIGATPLAIPQAWDRGNASGSAVQSNASSFNFPGVVFIWIGNGNNSRTYVKVEASVFEKYEDFTVTVKVGPDYYSWIIPQGPTTVYEIPRINGNVPNMAFFDGVTIGCDCPEAKCDCGGCLNEDCDCEDGDCCIPCWCCTCENTCDRCGDCKDCEGGCGGFGCDCDGCICDPRLYGGNDGTTAYGIKDGATQLYNIGTSYFPVVELDLALLNGGGIQIIDMIDSNNGNQRITRYGKAYLYLNDAGDLVAHFDGVVSGVTFDFFADGTVVPNSLQADAAKAGGSPVVVLNGGGKEFTGELLVYIRASNYKWYAPLPFIPKNVGN